jgi:F-type H+-transporting ATPase subunit delta
VASNTRSSGTAALRYASALADLAAEQNAFSQIEKDVADMKAMIANSADLRSFLASPLVGKGAALSTITALAESAKFSQLFGNFLLTLAKNGRLRDTESVLKAVENNLAARRGEVTAKVEAAQELSDAQKKELEQSLSKTIGRPVSLNVKVNKDLIGGLVVTLGSLQVDDSIKTKLDRLALAMKYNRDAA